jgi:hypothetical protein
MQTKLIAMAVSLVLPDESPVGLRGSKARRLRSDELRSHIETQLSYQGTPLRWAITAIDSVSQTAYVEAVVTDER